GFEWADMDAVRAMLKENNAMAEIVSKTHGEKKSQSGKSVLADKTYTTTASVLYDAVYIPGGSSIEKMKKMGDVHHFINESFKHCKPIGASAQAVDLLQKGHLGEVRMSGEQEQCVSDRGVVTCSDANQQKNFCESFLKALLQHRH